MPKLTIQVRTEDNLLDLLAKNESAAWVVGVEREPLITHVQVSNFNGTQMIEGVYDRAGSSRQPDGRLVIRFLDGRIVNCKIEFVHRGPVYYIEGNGIH